MSLDPKKSKWLAIMDEARLAENDRAAHAAFVKACARAFAGTGFRPLEFNAWNGIDGIVHEIHLKLSVRSIMEVVPLDELLPRPAAVADPRFHLRGQHPKRGRYTRRTRVSVLYLRAPTI